MSWLILNDKYSQDSSLNYSWRINGVIVNKSLPYSWGIFYAVGKILFYYWSIYNTVYKPLAYSWNVTGSLLRSLPYSWVIIDYLKSSKITILLKGGIKKKEFF